VNLILIWRPLKDYFFLHGLHSEHITIKMALSFSLGTGALLSWGFSAGDIAVMAGAGRAAGTWLVAQLKDRALIDFLSVDVDEIVTRRGLVDVNALHQRWDRKLTLLQNGRPVSIVHPAGDRKTVVENLDRFTWIMILVISALDASMSARELRAVMSRFLNKLFEESPTGTDYLERELNQHIQGWRSSACVRGVLHSARDSWESLGQQKLHWPGYVPRGDHGEILRLLFWLVNGLDPVFSTASSDVFCIAVVLQALGVEMTTVAGKVADADESRPFVCLDSSLITTGVSGTAKARWGMRIPLDFMQECVSVWPGDQGLNNLLRKIFEDGMDAVEADHAKVVLRSVGGMPVYRISTGYEKSTRKRLATHESRLAASFLPKHAYATAHGLGRLVGAMSSDDSSSLDSYLKRFPQPELIFNLENHISESALIQLQTFLMGFYYRLFAPLLDTLTLVKKEAFGSWAFADTQFLRQVMSFLADDFAEEWTLVSRPSLLGFVAYMFAGAQAEMIEGMTATAVGVVAKLSLLTQATLGTVTGFEEAVKFSLLDIDTAGIPCNAKGIVVEGSRLPFEAISVDRNGKKLDQFSDSDLKDGDTDFTSHIVPDWDHDVQACLVTFRHEGRLVHSLPPSLIEKALERVWLRSLQFHSSGEALPDNVDGVQVKNIDRVTSISISRHHGRRIFRAGEEDTALLIPSLKMPKARACILGMYQNFVEGTRQTEEYSFVPVGNYRDVVSALKQGNRNLVATEVPAPRFAGPLPLKMGEDESKGVSGFEASMEEGRASKQTRARTSSI
jgi:hypothetical protein